MDNLSMKTPTLRPQQCTYYGSYSLLSNYINLSEFFHNTRIFIKKKHRGRARAKKFLSFSGI